MKEVGFYNNRMVHALFTHPPFLIRKKSREGEMSQVFIFVLFLSFFRVLVMYLLFYFYNSVEHTQPFFLFGAVLIISTYPHSLYLVESSLFVFL